MKKSRVVILTIFSVALVASACRSTNLSPIGSHASFVPEDDERKLWEAGREAEQKVVPPNLTFEDPALNRYIRSLVDRLIPVSYQQAGGPPISVKVRKDPRLNAMAMPQGVIVLHTSVVARADDEAQVAGVLAHEITHITNRHQLREAHAIENRRTAINIAAFIGLLGLAALAADQANRGNYAAANALAGAAPPLLNLGLQLTYTAMVNGYSRDMEREADEGGMRLMAAAGYDPRELEGFFRKVLADSPDAGKLETFFYGNHPRTEERIETVERLAGSIAIDHRRAIDREAFDRQMMRVRIANAEFDANLGRMRLAKAQMNRVVGALPQPVKASAGKLFDGYLYAAASFGAVRAKNIGLTQRLIEAAARSYREAIAEAAASPQLRAVESTGYRALGLLYYAQRGISHRDCDAKASLEKYLELQPMATDRVDIAMKVARLDC